MDGVFIEQRHVERLREALRTVLAELDDEAPLTASAPVPAEPRPKQPNGSSPDTYRLQETARLIASADDGGGLFVPVPRSRTHPRYSDFAYILMRVKGVFTISELFSAVVPYVKMPGNERNAKAILRGAVAKDDRFMKLAPGRFQVKS